MFVNSSVSVRGYLGAGVAALSVGALVLGPVQPAVRQPAALPHHAAELAVGLAAAVQPLDPIAAIQAAFTATTNNLIALITNSIHGVYVQGDLATDSASKVGYATGVPLPIIQQMAQNIPTYLSELPDFGLIVKQMFGNIGNAFGAPFKPGVEIEAKDVIFGGTFLLNQNIAAEPPVGKLIVKLSQRLVAASLPKIAPDLAASLKPILDFATTPISGVLIGAVGPLLAPVLSVVNSITNTFALLKESNVLGALTELINIPTNAVSAFLNGGPILDATGLLGLITPLPDSVKKVGFQMGGLLSPGGVAGDTLAATADVTIPPNPPQPLVTTGLPVGPIGALVNMTNYIATAIKVSPPPTAATAASSAPKAVASTAAAPAAAVSASAPVADAPAPVAIEAPAEALKSVEIAEPLQDSTPAPSHATRGRAAAAAAGSDDNNGSATTAGPHRKRGAA